MSTKKRRSPPSTKPQREIWRLERVMAATGKCRTDVYADPTMPRRVKIGRRAVGWFSDEILSWVATRRRADSRPAVVKP